LRGELPAANFNSYGDVSIRASGISGGSRWKVETTLAAALAKSHPTPNKKIAKALKSIREN
jgi:hypothetical protein